MPSGCIALPYWLRKTFFLGDDLIGHRLTVTYVQAHELPVAEKITVRCIAKDPPTLPKFVELREEGDTSKLFASLTNWLAVLKQHTQKRNFVALSVGARFSLFYCSQNGGGRWDFEVSGVKHRRNNHAVCDTKISADEMAEGSIGCVFSNCENLGMPCTDFVCDADYTVSAPQSQPADMFDIQNGEPVVPVDFILSAAWTLDALASASHGCSPQQEPVSKFQEVFSSAPDVLAFAPGRLEFLGNHLDYNGGAVLGAAIDNGVTACAALDRNTMTSYMKLATSKSELMKELSTNWVSVCFDDESSEQIPKWAAYAVRIRSLRKRQTIRFQWHATDIYFFVDDVRQVGVLHVMRRAGMQTPCGCKLYLHSSLDIGAGVRSLPNMVLLRCIFTVLLQFECCRRSGGRRCSCQTVRLPRL